MVVLFPLCTLHVLGKYSAALESETPSNSGPSPPLGSPRLNYNSEICSRDFESVVSCISEIHPKMVFFLFDQGKE